MPLPEQIPRRSKRERKFPAEYGSVEATSYTPNPGIPMANERLFEERLDPPEPVQEPVALLRPDTSTTSSLHSPPNQFHVFRVLTEPQRQENPATQGQLTVEPQITHPFRNDAYFEMMKTTVLAPSSKTPRGSDDIVEKIIDRRLNDKDLVGYKSETQLKVLDKYSRTSPIAGGPWRSASVKVKMPRKGAANKKDKLAPTTERNAPEIEVHGIQHRSLVDLIISKVQQSSTSKPFTGTPFTEWWCPPQSTKPIRIYGEAYSSDVAIKLYEDIKKVPPPPDHPNIQSVVVLVMLGSDATHLADFGTASLWPVYVFFGNESKYETSKQSQSPAYHLAYLPKVR